MAAPAGLRFVGARRLGPAADRLPVRDLGRADVGDEAKLAPVLKAIELSHQNKIHMEMTNLLMPTLNDSEEQIQKLIDFVASLSDRIPVHFSRYFPAYRADLPPTPMESLQKAFLLAKRKLKYVFIGNAYIPNTSNTYCPQCNNLLVKRNGYHTAVVGIEGRKCGNCGAVVDVVTG